MTPMIGASQNFFLSRMYAQNSPVIPREAMCLSKNVTSEHPTRSELPFHAACAPVSFRPLLPESVTRAVVDQWIARNRASQ